MGKRLGKALQALGLVLLITVACFAFMPWQMSDVIDGLGDVNRCMILRYDHSYSTAYPQEQALETVADALCGAKGTFDRNRSQLVYSGDAPMYRIYLWTHGGRISDIWLCDSAIFYDGAQYILHDDDAERVNAALASCFS